MRVKQLFKKLEKNYRIGEESHTIWMKFGLIFRKNLKKFNRAEHFIYLDPSTGLKNSLVKRNVWWLVAL